MEDRKKPEFCQFCLTKQNLIEITCEVSTTITSFSVSLEDEARICLNCNNSFICIKKFQQNCLTAQSLLERCEKFNSSDAWDDSIGPAFDTIYSWLETVKAYLEEKMFKQEEQNDDFISDDNVKQEEVFSDEESLEKYFKEDLQGNRRPYKCPKCNKYYTKGELKYHLNVHNNIRPFKCVKEDCPSTFSSPRLMRVHARRFHQMKVKPEKSSYSRRRVKDRRYHEITETDEKLEKTKIDVICSICGKEVRKKHFSTHFRTHYADKQDLSCPYTTQNCYEKFQKRHLLTSHIQRRHDPSYIPELGPADRICELCGKCFSKATIKYHMNVHLNRTPYNCDFENCKESFKDPTLLRQHKRSFHLKIKTWRCRYCPKKISSQAEYEAHKLENCGVKSVACHICGKFINKMNVKCHLAIHKGERNFICPVEGCNKAFLLKNKLQQHSRSHSTELKFECTYCKCAFKVKQSLTAHIARKHAAS